MAGKGTRTTTTTKDERILTTTTTNNAGKGVSPSIQEKHESVAQPTNKGVTTSNQSKNIIPTAANVASKGVTTADTSKYVAPVTTAGKGVTTADTPMNVAPDTTAGKGTPQQTMNVAPMIEAATATKVNPIGVATAAGKNTLPTYTTPTAAELLISNLKKQLTDPTKNVSIGTAPVLPKMDLTDATNVAKYEPGLMDVVSKAYFPEAPELRNDPLLRAFDNGSIVTPTNGETVPADTYTNLRDTILNILDGGFYGNTEQPGMTSAEGLLGLTGLGAMDLLTSDPNESPRTRTERWLTDLAGGLLGGTGVNALRNIRQSLDATDEERSGLKGRVDDTITNDLVRQAIDAGFGTDFGKDFASGDFNGQATSKSDDSGKDFANYDGMVPVSNGGSGGNGGRGGNGGTGLGGGLPSINLGDLNLGELGGLGNLGSLLDLFNARLGEYDTGFNAWMDALLGQYNTNYDALEDLYNAVLGNLNTSYNDATGLLDSRLQAAREELENSRKRSLQEAYISRMMQQKALRDQLDAYGLTGGASESILSNIFNTYLNNRNSVEENTQTNLRDLLQNYLESLNDLKTKYNTGLIEAENNRLTGRQNLANALLNAQTNAIGYRQDNRADAYNDLFNTIAGLYKASL